MPIIKMLYWQYNYYGIGVTKLMELSNGSFTAFENREEKIKIGTWRFRARGSLAIVNSALREKGAGAI